MKVKRKKCQHTTKRVTESFEDKTAPTLEDEVGLPNGLCVSLHVCEEEKAQEGTVEKTHSSCLEP